jgi:pimeloyl-ACP methyl ester carboxylesterase
MNRLFTCLCLIALSLHAFAGDTSAKPPLQPASGPGGANHAHARVIGREVRGGAQGWWLFTPADPTPAQAPVVVFLHGWGAMNPRVYRGWIDHIVRRGMIVVFPNYQDSLFTHTATFLPNAIAGISGALADLSTSTIHPDLSHIAVVGHSAGGLLSAEVAARAAAENLPPFRVVMPVEPGDGDRGGARRSSIPSIDVGGIPASALLVVVGAEDRLAGEKLGLKLYDQAVRVPAANKNVVELQSDYHGTPALIANHAAPAAILDPKKNDTVNQASNLFPQRDLRNKDSIDAIDWYGPWKLFDALCDAAFSGAHRDVALGGTPAQLGMGVWSDGIAVKPMRVLR